MIFGSIPSQTILSLYDLFLPPVEALRLWLIANKVVDLRSSLLLYTALMIITTTWTPKLLAALPELLVFLTVHT